MKTNNPAYSTMAWFIKEEINGKDLLESLEIAKNHPGICSIITVNGIASHQYLDGSVLNIDKHN